MGEDAKKRCPDCDSEMQSFEVPNDILRFTLPFFRHIEIAIMNYHNLEWYCSQCKIDSEQRGYDEMAFSIGEHAYREGFRDGQNA